MTEETSTPPTVHQALIAVRRAVGVVGKGGYNPQGKFNFRGIDAIVNATAGPLLDAGVNIYPEHIVSVEQVDVLSGKNRTPMQAARCVIRYRVVGPAGDSFTMEAAGEAYDSGDKATPKASTVAWRTALLQALHLPTDDPDPDSFDYSGAGEQQQNPQPYPADEPDPYVVAKNRAWAATAGAGDPAARTALLADRLGRLDPPATIETATAGAWDHVAVGLELNGFNVPRPSTEQLQQQAHDSRVARDQTIDQGPAHFDVEKAAAGEQAWSHPEASTGEQF